MSIHRYETLLKMYGPFCEIDDDCERGADHDGPCGEKIAID